MQPVYFRQTHKNRPVHGTTAVLVLAINILISGCATHKTPPPAPDIRPDLPAPLVRYTVQVGAYKVYSNAVRMAEKLRRYAIDAWYFIDTDGYYKVRFGDYPKYELAAGEADSLQRLGIIKTYFVVSPERYPVAPAKPITPSIRDGIVATAKRFIGKPYKYGSADPENGFDCSGLTMTVFRLNGLNLPRTSRDQFETGVPVDLAHLRPGDLVFFRHPGRATVTHVGIYIGDNMFIHAPGRGKIVREDSLKNRFWVKYFAGGRAYFDVTDKPVILEP